MRAYNFHADIKRNLRDKIQMSKFRQIRGLKVPTVKYSLPIV